MSEQSRGLFDSWSSAIAIATAAMACLGYAYEVGYLSAFSTSLIGFLTLPDFLLELPRTIILALTIVVGSAGAFVLPLVLFLGRTRIARVLFSGGEETSTDKIIFFNVGVGIALVFPIIGTIGTTVSIFSKGAFAQDFCPLASAQIGLIFLMAGIAVAFISIGASRRTKLLIGVAGCATTLIVAAFIIGNIVGDFSKIFNREPDVFLKTTQGTEIRGVLIQQVSAGLILRGVHGEHYFFVSNSSIHMICYYEADCFGSFVDDPAETKPQDSNR